MAEHAIHQVINAIGDEDQDIRNMTVDEARQRLLAADPAGVLGISGSFALVARAAERVCLARSLNRPLRYFLAKGPDGPILIVADRIDRLRDVLEREGYLHQFHPSYTRMAPAHCVTELRLVGCPDPGPTYRRFFNPPRATLPPDPDVIGSAYVEALCAEIQSWLDSLPAREPIGVLFSGGADSSAVLLCVHQALIARGESPARLKAFTLAVDGGGADRAQAREFLRQAGLAMLGEAVEVQGSELDPLEAVRVIEDYKPLDVECATMVLALLKGIRSRYPAWRVLADGDGGDENLRDYPIEENAELTIKSVVSNRLLYHEGWGVDALKHSLTYSGGLSRGCVRGYAPARRLGFSVFSPFTAPNVVAVAEAIPFAELTNGSHSALYALKGEVLHRGIRRVLGREFPVYPKRRFQHGAAPDAVRGRHFAGDLLRYRRHFSELYGPS
jgi:asparagine synthase (glutamine-hydrolysing)